MAPSETFLEALAGLRDVNGYTGKLSIDCHQGVLMVVEVPHEAPRERYILQDRRVDLTRRSKIATLTAR